VLFLSGPLPGQARFAEITAAVTLPCYYLATRNAPLLAHTE
jgi:hypothetical protein